MVTVLALMAAATLQAPPSSVRLECEIPGRPGHADSVPIHLSITLALEGRRIASVLVDGPSVFSSYRIRRVRRDSPELGAADPNPQLLPRSAQWRGNFQGRALRLRRERTDMVLEPSRDAAGAYSGFWTYVEMMESRRLEANGPIACLTAAGTLSGGAA